MKYQLSFELSFTENTYPGRYYAFEGIDGSGKTTQVHKLAAYFQSQGNEVVITKEPTDNVIGQLIKKVLHKEISVPPMTLQYLFAADRGLHLETEVIPALKSGKIVISDRSFWSSVAYGIADLPARHPENQTRHSGPDPESQKNNDKMLNQVQHDEDGDDDRERLLVAYNILTLYNGYIVPDKTFVIDVPAELAIERVKQRHEDITLYEYTEKLQKVQQEYAWMAGKFEDKILLIGGTQSVDEVFNHVVSSL